VQFSKFISFEGIDGSGKSTQIDLLNQELSLKGEKVVVLREPGGTKISEKIRKILLDKKNSNLSNEAESLLFFASRNQLLKEKIIPMLKNGYFVICDRFNDSTIAYQGYGFDIDYNILESISTFATSNNQPSLTFYLDILPSVSVERRKSILDDRIEDKGIEYMKKVRAGFLSISKKNPHRIININGALDKIEISRIIWRTLKEKYEF
tara:strand:+ start:533 stop:1156 length:624 start_codon:yes stop_codon:yes gene_type:complete